MKRTPVRGRPRNPEGAMVYRNIAYPKALLDKLDELVGEDESGTKGPAIVRQALAAFLGGGMEIKVAGPAQEVKLKFLATAPAGPWEKAVAQAGEYTLSRQTYEELYLRDGDVMVRVSGNSMKAMGIPDRALLAVRPLVNGKPPSYGATALVQIVVGKKGQDQEYKSTIKKWYSETDLRDGDDKPFPLPANTQEVRAVAEAAGIISAL